MEIDKDFFLKVGMRIREARESAHMSREKFSEKCDISTSFLTAVENGHKGITGKTIYKICKAAPISADYLIFGLDNKHVSGALLEEFSSLNQREQEHAIQILSEYIKSVHEISGSGESNPQ